MFEHFAMDRIDVGEITIRVRYGGQGPPLSLLHGPPRIHTMCEDYRAGATIDVAIDAAGHGKNKITCPVFALWSKQDDLDEWYDVLGIWREWTKDV